MPDLRRREFITLLGGAAAAWPLVAHAQQAVMPVIGFLSGASAKPYAPMVAAFRQGLSEIGYVEGRNVTIEFRWAEGQYDKLPALVANLVRRPVSVIAATTVPAVPAAKAATTTIPIVFVAGGDPVQQGLVASLNRPGGNLTGVTTMFVELGPKRLQLLRELVPTATSIAALVNPTGPIAETLSRDLRDAAGALGLRLDVLHASSERDFDAAFATVAQLRAGALLIVTDPFFVNQSEQLAALALHHAIPTIYFAREFVAAGGLMSYGSSLTDAYRLAGTYTGRVLKGEKPADLAVQQSTKVELIINLRTAKALGLTLPLSLLGRADEVIE
jgi:putative tryptophan/tyrosine transport system substrate-binding protein